MGVPFAQTLHGAATAPRSNDMTTRGEKLGVSGTILRGMPALTDIVFPVLSREIESVGDRQVAGRS